MKIIIGEMMKELEDLLNFLKKKGIHDTFRVLTKFEKYKTDMRTFFKELKEISYYNSFYRVKDALIKKGIIIMRKSKNQKFIELTQKGITIYNKLIELNELIRQ